MTAVTPNSRPAIAAAARRLAALLLLVFVGLGAPLLSAQTGPQPSRKALPSLDSTDVLRPGDKVIITLSDFPNPPSPAEITISEDGKVTLHLNQSFSAAGRTRTQLQDEIHLRYVPNYYKNMTVSVKPEERFIFVGGYVRKPDRYPYTAGLTVLKAISIGGDFSEFGKKTEVQIIRADGRTETLDCEKAIKDPRHDRPVFPGDRIYVPKRFF